MPSLWLIIAITVVQTFGEVMSTRGLFYFTRNILSFTDSQNLMFGMLVAFCGASASLIGHRPAARLGPRRWLLLAIGLRISADLILLAHPSGAWLVGGAMLRWFAGGALWPVIQSYLAAGRSMQQTARALGWFNVSWAIAIPLGVMPTGWIIDHYFPGLFIVGAIFHGLTFCLCWTLPSAPVHSANGATQTLSDEEALSLQPLLISARWANFSQALLLNLIIAIMPGVMRSLGESVTMATFWSSLGEWARMGMFILMTLVPMWHGRRGGLVMIALALPTSILMILLGDRLAWVIIGQVIYGLAGGAGYTASLYYGMVLQNASVKSAGRHEGFGSLGGTVGPAAGLLCQRLTILWGATLGTLVGMAPALLLCAGGTLWPLIRRERRRDGGG